MFLAVKLVVAGHSRGSKRRTSGLCFPAFFFCFIFVLLTAWSGNQICGRESALDPASGDVYYVNTTTMQTSWDKPVDWDFHHGSNTTES